MGHRVLVVLDPHFSRDSALEASTLVDWVTYDYPVKMAASLLSSQALRGSVFRGETDRIIRKRPGFVPVLLHEKVGNVKEWEKSQAHCVDGSCWSGLESNTREWLWTSCSSENFGT
jgi:hypothetical protein